LPHGRWLDVQALPIEKNRKKKTRDSGGYLSYVRLIKLETGSGNELWTVILNTASSGSNVDGTIVYIPGPSRVREMAAVST
jgi:hypothetical protein